MAEIPEHLLRRSAEAKAKALGLPVEQVLAEMKGEAPPTPTTEPSVAEASAQAAPVAEASAQAADAPVAEASAQAADAPVVEPVADTAAEPAAPAAVEQAVPAPVATAVTEPAPEPPAGDVEPPSGNGGPAGNGGRVATSVSPRPVAPAESGPEGVRTQRLLTVVKAKAIQQVKAEPTDKVSTWPHLMIAEFASLLAVTAVLLVLSVILQAPLLEAANFNATPNPSKAPWYFLGLQELLSYFDPQIAGVTVPTIVGLIGFMAIPYVDRNPSIKPSDRKFAIFMYTFFFMGSSVLTILGVLFRGPGFNFTYPWADGIFFDDLKDWVNFE